MRLYDVQVMLNASNSVDKQQFLAQQQGQLTQSQNAMAINDTAAVKLFQAQESQAESNSKQISPEDQKQRKRLRTPVKQRKPDAEDESSIKNTGYSGRIIDMKI
jgi:heme-binding NEAT domain protein